MKIYKLILNYLDIGYLKLNVGYSLFLISLLFHSVCFSQQDTAIVRTYGGSYYEEGRQIIECAAGGYAIIGTTGSDLQNNTNFYLLRIDEELNCMWSKSLGGIEVEWGYSLVEDEEGNLLLCGYTNSFGAGAYDALVYKVDAMGEIIWQHTYGGTDWDFAYKIIAHPEGGYLICGKTYSLGNGGSDGYLLHIDNDGNIFTEWTYGGVGDDEFVDVEVNEFIYLAQNDMLNGNSQPRVLKLNLDGIMMSATSFDWGNEANIVALEISQEFIIGLGNVFHSDNTRQGVISKWNNNFEMEWGLIQPAADGHEYTAISIADDEFIIAGNTNVFGTGAEDVIFHRREFDSNWTAGPTFGGLENDFVYSCLITISSQVIAVGKSNSHSGIESYDLYLIRLQDEVLTPEYYETENYNLGCFSVDIEVVKANGDVFIFGNESIKINLDNISYSNIYDIQGKLILNTSSSFIKTEEISQGVYLINSITQNGKKYISKFVKT